MADLHAQEASHGHSGSTRDGAYGNAQTAPRWEEPSPLGRLSRAIYALGSIVSVGLVIGLGLWGYKLLVRDVSGVPVIRAATGPIRVQPEDPGGRQTLNQGFSVNAVAALGTAGAAPDELILAPPPLDLGEEDAPGGPAARHPAARQSADDTPQPADEAVQPVPSADDGTEAMLALADAVSEGVPPIEPVEARQTPPDDAPRDAVTQALALALASIDGAGQAAEDDIIPTSLRPRARPGDLSNIRQVAATAPGTGTRDVDPDSIAMGTRLAQLGAFASEEIAREEWGRLDAQFAEYLAGKDRVIQRATSGGRTFYRLRAVGFDDLADARRFCSALVAEKAECIPVVTR